MFELIEHEEMVCTECNGTKMCSNMIAMKGNRATRGLIKIKHLKIFLIYLFRNKKITNCVVFAIIH